MRIDPGLWRQRRMLELLDGATRLGNFLDLGFFLFRMMEDPSTGGGVRVLKPKSQ